MAGRWILTLKSLIYGEEKEKDREAEQIANCRHGGKKTEEENPESTTHFSSNYPNQKNRQRSNCRDSFTFKMPVHYPRYKRQDYENMEEWKLDILFEEYGLNIDGSLEEKRLYAIRTFLWPEKV